MAISSALQPEAQEMHSHPAIQVVISGLCMLQICPSTGRPCDCGAATESSGLPTSTSGSSDEAADVPANGHANGHTSAANGTCKDPGCGHKDHGSTEATKFASGGISDDPKVDVLSDSKTKKDDSMATVKQAQAPQQKWTSAVEPIFPAELRKRSPPELHLPGPYATWHRYNTSSAALYNAQFALPLQTPRSALDKCKTWIQQ